MGVFKDAFKVFIGLLATILGSAGMVLAVNFFISLLPKNMVESFKLITGLFLIIISMIIGMLVKKE